MISYKVTSGFAILDRASRTILQATMSRGIAGSVFQARTRQAWPGSPLSHPTFNKGLLWANCRYPYTIGAPHNRSSIHPIHYRNSFHQQGIRMEFQPYQPGLGYSESSYIEYDDRPYTGPRYVPHPDYLLSLTFNQYRSRNTNRSNLTRRSRGIRTSTSETPEIQSI